MNNQIFVPFFKVDCTEKNGGSSSSAYGVFDAALDRFNTSILSPFNIHVVFYFEVYNKENITLQNKIIISEWKLKK